MATTPPQSRVDNNSAASPNERPTKKRRIALACEKCRERKSRCDGKHPMCGACSSNGTECRYPLVLSKTDQLRQEFSATVSNLDHRMKGLERILHRLEGHLAPNSPPSPTPLASRESETNPSRDETILIPQAALQDAPLMENVADGIATIPLSSRQDCAFFGPSSNIAFLRKVSLSLAKSVGRPSIPAPRDVMHNDEFSSEITASLPHGDISLRNLDSLSNKAFSFPPDHKVKALLHAWFMNGGHVHAFVHQGRLMDTYEELRRTGFLRVRRSWLALVYMLFALSAIAWPYRASFFAHTNTESEEWYNMASDLCMKSVFSESGVNVEVVQSLMCMVMHLQSTQHSTKTWLIHGLCVRLAYQLGLHSPCINCTDPIEKETRKRTWCYLVILDRTLSMSFGRPGAIQDQKSHLDPPSLYQDSASRGVLDKDSSTLTFLSGNFDLYEIVERATRELYRGNSGIKMEFNMATISRIHSFDGDLLGWASSLPHQHSIMQSSEFVASASQTQPIDQLAKFSLRQRTVLTLRYLHVRIYIHRPLLEGLLEAIHQENPDVRMLRILRQASFNSISVILSCARRIICVVDRLVAGTAQGQQQLGAWWYTLQYTLNAALAICGCIQASRPVWDCPKMLPQADLEAAFSELNRSVNVLDTLNEGHPTVTKCKSYLEETIQMTRLLRDQERLRKDDSHDLLRPESHAHPAVDTASPQAMRSGHDMALLQNGHPASSSISNFMSDTELDSFLFPTDMQMVGGDLSTVDPFLI